MFTFRTNHTSSHTHFINGIGSHDTYVEWAWVNVFWASAAWIAGAITTAFAGDETKPAKLSKSRLRDIIRDHFATFGASIRNADEFATKLAKSQSVGLARVWVKRSHAVRMLAYHLSTLAVDAAKPRTVESLHDILGFVAWNCGVNPPVVDAALMLVADEILFDVLPLFGEREFDGIDDVESTTVDTVGTVETLPDVAGLIESTATVETETPAIVLESDPAIADMLLAESTTVETPATTVETVTVETATVETESPETALAATESTPDDAPATESRKRRNRR